MLTTTMRRQPVPRWGMREWPTPHGLPQRPPAGGVGPAGRATGRRSRAGVDSDDPVSCHGLPLANPAIWQAGCRVHPGRLEHTACSSVFFQTLTYRVHGRPGGPQVWGARPGPGGPRVRHSPSRPAVHSRDKSAARCGHRPPRPHDARSSCGAPSMLPGPAGDRAAPSLRSPRLPGPGLAP